MDYYKLTPAVRESLERIMKEKFAGTGGVTQDLIKVEFSAGSVKVKVVITGAAQGMSTPTADELTNAVKLVPDIDSVIADGRRLDDVVASEPVVYGAPDEATEAPYEIETTSSTTEAPDKVVKPLVQTAANNSTVLVPAGNQLVTVLGIVLPICCCCCTAFIVGFLIRMKKKPPAEKEAAAEKAAPPVPVAPVANTPTVGTPVTQGVPPA